MEVEQFVVQTEGHTSTLPMKGHFAWTPSVGATMLANHAEI